MSDPGPIAAPLDEPPGSLPGPRADQPYPTRRELVREAAPSTSARGLRATITDTYTTVLEVALATLFLIGGSSSLRTSLQAGLASRADGPGYLTSTSAVLVAAGLSCAIVAFGLAALCRLGPVSLGTAPTTWWTPLPVPRADLLRPVLRSRALISALAGGLVVAWASSVGFGVTGEFTGATVLPGLLGGFGLGAGAAVAGYALILRPAIRGGIPALLRAGMLLDALGVALVLALAVSSFARVGVDAVHPTALTLPALVVAAVALVVLVVVGLRSWRDVADTPAPSLRRGAARLERLTSSVLQFDVREFGRALAADAPGQRRHSRYATGRRVRWVSGPVSAVLLADWLLLRRQPRRLVTSGVLLFVPLVVAAGTSAHRAVAAALLWVAGYAAATTLAEAARGTVLAPAAARTLPISSTRL
ncbi:MAG: DUF6297 family protein, partial [Janthinobacterium lividum]